MKSVRYAAAALALAAVVGGYTPSANAAGTTGMGNANPAATGVGTGMTDDRTTVPNNVGGLTGTTGAPVPGASLAPHATPVPGATPLPGSTVSPRANYNGGTTGIYGNTRGKTDTYTGNYNTNNTYRTNAATRDNTRNWSWLGLLGLLGLFGMRGRNHNRDENPTR